MCTIGCVVDRVNGSVLTFKQCDLRETQVFRAPEVRAGSGSTRRVGFERSGASGPWAGFNDSGLCLVSADAYLDRGVLAALDAAFDLRPGDVLAAYGAVLAECRSARAASEWLCGFYAHHDWPDIVLVSDRDGAFLIEHCPGHGFERATLEVGFLVATNHFRMLPGAVSFEDDASSYLRLERAEALLAADPSADGVRALCADQAFGPNERSLCRVAETPGEYFTQASLVVELRAAHEGIDCSYVLNGNAARTAWTHWDDVFGPARASIH